MDTLCTSKLVGWHTFGNHASVEKREEQLKPDLRKNKIKICTSESIVHRRHHKRVLIGVERRGKWNIVRSNRMRESLKKLTINGPQLT